jgi:TRAP-type mannitol/chloroaromatic compound transport system permease large subunit
VIAGVLQATSLTFPVAATQIGLQLGAVSRASAAGLVAAGLLSVVISPALALVLLCREQPDTRSGWTARSDGHMIKGPTAPVERPLG